MSPIKKLAKRALGEDPYNRLSKTRGRWRRKMADMRWRWSWEGRDNQRRLNALRNAYQGKRCFIIGNGPSLKKTDVRLLSKEVTIGCNGLFLLFGEMGYLPTFYAVEDYLVAEDRAEQINQIRGTTKVFPRRLAYCLLPDQDTIYINFRYEHFKDRPRFNPRFDQLVYWGGTVTYLNIQLAYYIGCREVYLIGVDHNYRVPSQEEIDEKKVIVSKEEDPNHFHPDYFGPGYRWHDPKVERMEQSYLSAKEFGDAHGLKIYNATAGGKLEIFPRVDYDEVVGKTAKGI